MRCLYCGKELALLKRLTGGEFCSDAHRQQYKEEYNQLALNRLLQAKDQPKTDDEDQPEPPSVTVSPSVSRSAWDQLGQNDSNLRESLREEPGMPIRHAAPENQEPEVVAPARRYLELVRENEPPGAGRAEAEPAILSPVAAEATTAPVEEAAPAEPSGFVADLPVPVTSAVGQMAVVESDLEHNPEPSLPVRDPEVSETQLFEAAQVAIEPSTRFRDYATRRGERGPEIREFGRSAPGIEMNWPAAGETALDTSEEPMEIQTFPHPPEGSPRLWEESEREFEAFETELGALARIVFGTTGLEDKPEGDKSEEEGNDAGSPASWAALNAHAEDSREGSGAAVRDVAPGVNGFGALAEPAAPFLSSPAEPAPEPVPDLVTKPLPLTLHGLAAGRGKPVQVFSAAAAGFEVHIPRSSALPLRPLMIVGATTETAEPARKIGEKKEPERIAVKNGSTVIDSRKPSISRTDSRPDTATTRKLEVRSLQPETRPTEKRGDQRLPVSGPAHSKDKPGLKPKPGPEAASVAKNAAIAATETKPDKIGLENRKAVPEAPVRLSKEWARPAPLAAPPTSEDLGLPSLDLKRPSGSLWSRIPMPAKIGAAAAVLILAGVIATASITYFSKRGPRVVEAGPALAVSGWVKDWDTGPEVQVTVLQGTSNLADYRAQFQVQIETKAVGWVFRARDPKNFYASKLEVVKTGAIWTAVLARFAVIDGHEEPRAHVPLSLAVQENTVYKIRLEAVGDHFSTWIQEQKVDEFTDGRIKTGGVGLYSERGESALLKGDLSVIPLAIKR